VIEKKHTTTKWKRRRERKERRRNFMKKDLYLKIILTIIAICLVWICIRDVTIGPNKAYARDAGSSNTMDVNIESSDAFALEYAGPMEVKVINWPASSPAPQEKR